MSVIVQELFGYKVLAKVGTGARSTLYAVQEPRTKQIWALKHVIRNSDKDDRFIEQVESEYDVMRKLDHPAIRAAEALKKVRKGLIGKTTEIGLLMEFVDASTLDEDPPATLAGYVSIFAQVARGLHHMHSKGFVHADMKPTNVMVLSGGGVKVIDLGQACAIGTVKKRIQGTPGYMAPEQAHRQAVTQRTDVYNFGATMYFAIVGEVIPTALPPKGGASLVGTALDASQIKAPIPPHLKVPEVHPILSAIILDCVKVLPGDRTESMDRVVQRLDDLSLLLEAQPGGVPMRRKARHADKTRGSWDEASADTE
ncbi:MAG: serine/threonine protein kinase [Phycisphaerales bacterium]|nr:serine/threonine protein kinase [Phycisphaerales bacterium]